MAIDASIYAQLLRPVKSVAEYDAEALQGQRNRLALQADQAQFTDRARAIEDGNRLRQVVAGFGADTSANKAALLSAGRLDEALKYDKSNADIEKIRSDAKKSDASAIETHLKSVNLKLGQAKDVLNTMQTPEQAAAWVHGMYADPDLAQVFKQGGDTPEAAISRIPTDPKAFQKWKMQASLGADKLIEYTTPSANTVAANEQSNTNSVRSAASSKYSADSSAATARRGQDLVDDRTREANAAGKVPTGYRQNADGTLSFIPGGPADPAAAGGKAPTEFQGKSAAFGARAEQADKIIENLTGKYSPAAINSKNSVEKTWLVGGAIGAATNLALPAATQQAEQAQRDFINAVLRQESGAAIAESEFDNARKQYFPQPGDSAAVIKQKTANRKLAVKGLKNNAGRAAFSAPSDSDVPDDIAALLNKHGGK